MKRRKWISVLMAVVLLLQILPFSALARVSPEPNLLMGVPVGTRARELGVIYYTQLDNGEWRQNRVHTVYVLGSESVEGTVRIEPIGSGEGWLLQLMRHGQTWSITWNEKAGEFLLRDNEDRAAKFSWNGKASVAQTDGSKETLEENLQYVKLLAAVSVDFH